MKKALIPAILLSAALPLSAFAHDVSVEVTNLTNGSYFTPLLVAAHTKHVDLFEPGMPASPALQAMAEGGDLAGLVSDLGDAGARYETDPAGGLLAPGQSAVADLRGSGNRNKWLSVVAMILPTNDGFIGLDSVRIPKKPGRYTYYLSGYDAGTEANDEIINGGGMPGVPGIPADPGGNSGTGATGAAAPDTNSNVHVHRGVLGDMDNMGGISDLNSTVHRWLNPVAKVVIKVRK